RGARAGAAGARGLRDGRAGDGAGRAGGDGHRRRDGGALARGRGVRRPAPLVAACVRGRGARRGRRAARVRRRACLGRSRGLQRRPDVDGPEGDMTFRLHNTLTSRAETFAPGRPPEVRMYVCGPTVYGRAHIGNFRSFIATDLLRRTLRYKGWRVNEV